MGAAKEQAGVADGIPHLPAPALEAIDLSKDGRDRVKYVEEEEEVL